MPIGAGFPRNTSGAHGKTTLNDTADRLLIEVEAGGAITAGDVVLWDTMTADTNPTVSQADVGSDNDALICGVAVDAAAAAGDTVVVCRNGPALVNISTATITVGDLATMHASADGCADGATGSGSTVMGDYFGAFISAEIGSTNQAIVDVRCGC